ncbi:hypothetical protein X975_12160, partial [Stegodyphus mimosarum]
MHALSRYISDKIPTVKCWNSGALGHIRRNCRTPQSKENNTGDINRELNAMRWKKSDKKPKCWNCGVQGHIRKNCRISHSPVNKIISQQRRRNQMNDHVEDRRLPDNEKLYFKELKISAVSGNSNGLSIDGHIDGVPSNMIIDTGANVTVIRKDLVQLFKDNLIWTPSCVTLQTTSSEKMDIGKLNIIAGDYNAHNTIWGYATTDIKGRFMEDFLSSYNLTLHNTRDAPPTFDRIHAQGWPDLTISSATAAHLIQDWTVDDEVSLSDHRYITFKIAQPTTVNVFKRYNLPGRQKRAFTNKVKTLLGNIEQQLPQANTKEDLENFPAEIQKSIQQACNDKLPQRSAKKLHTLNWWNSEPRTQQKKCRALRRKLKQERRLNLTAVTLSIYRRERARCKRSILQAKLNSWRTFCTEKKRLWYSSQDHD